MRKHAVCCFVVRRLPLSRGSLKDKQQPKAIYAPSFAYLSQIVTQFGIFGATMSVPSHAISVLDASEVASPLLLARAAGKGSLLTDDLL